MQEEREAREVARSALALLSDWLEHAGGAKRPGAGRNRILEGPTLDALARLRPPTAAALADLRDVPRFSKNKRKQYGGAIVAALLQARPFLCAPRGLGLGLGLSPIHQCCGALASRAARQQHSEAIGAAPLPVLLPCCAQMGRPRW